MGIRSECETYYKTQRKIQAESDLVLRPFKDMPKISEYYEQFFHKVAGFFLIEDTVLSTTQGLLTKQWVDDLWDVATREIARVLPGHLRQCETVGSLAFSTHDTAALPPTTYPFSPNLRGRSATSPCFSIEAVFYPSPRRQRALKLSFERAPSSIPHYASRWWSS
jgi:hypothetical protein